MKQMPNIANKNQQAVKAVKQTTEPKKGKVTKGRDLRTGRK